MTMLFVLLAAGLSLAIAGGTHRALAGVRARRRTAWELDRAEWRRWIRRPEPARTGV
jgi:hypothetical protein